MSQLYVPDKVWLVCSDGMKKNQLKVTSQSTVQIADGRLVGTVNDRFDGNFVCSKMVIAGAILGALVAAVIIASGGAVLGLGAAAGGAVLAAGGAAGGGLLAMMPSICSMFCMGSQWQPVHPKVMIQNQKALIQNSKINCFLGGNIMIFYSENAAEEFSDLVMQNTFVKVGGIILGSALLSAGVASILTSGSAFWTNLKFIKGAFGSGAAFMFAGEGAVLLTFGIGASIGADKVKGFAYEGIQKATDFKIKDYADRKTISEIETITHSSEMPIDIQESASNMDYIADGSGVLGKNHNPNISQYEIWEHQQQAGLYGNDVNITESNPQNTSSRAPNTIPELNPQVLTDNPTPSHMNDGRYTYVDRINSRYETGSQIHRTSWKEFRGKLGNSLFNAVPDADTYKAREIGKKRPFPIEMAIDVYNILSNWLLEGAIKEFKDAEKFEDDAKKGVTVSESTI